MLSEHPYGVLDGAPWVSAEQLNAAALFRDYLLSPEQQRKAVALRLRPPDRAHLVRKPFASPSATRQLRPAISSLQALQHTPTHRRRHTS